MTVRELAEGWLVERLHGLPIAVRFVPELSDEIGYVELGFANASTLHVRRDFRLGHYDRKQRAGEGVTKAALADLVCSLVLLQIFPPETNDADPS
jgi:hypothetical protein